MLDRMLRGAVGGEGGTALVEAPAGGGKSALLTACMRRAGDLGLAVLHARGSELRRGFAFAAMRQLLAPLLVAADAAERDRLLAGAAAPARAALLPTPGEGAGELELVAVVDALHWVVAGAAERGPLLLVVDDLHWVDPSSLRALSHLTGRLPDLPVVLVTAMRPDEPGTPEGLLDALRTAPETVRLALSALSPDAVARLVGDGLPEADGGVARAVAEATAGNPFLVHELLRVAAVDGWASDDGFAERVREAAVPLLGDRVRRRIAPAGDAAAALAAAMAVLGDGGRLAAAARLADAELQEAGHIAHRLRRMEVLAAEDPFEFVHPLVRRSVYDALPATRRAALHERAAEVLAAEGAPAQAVSAHVDALPPAGSPEVARTLLAAADAALGIGAVDEAARWLRRALAEGADDPPRATLLARLGTAELVAGEPEADAHLEEALALSADAAPRAQIALTLAEAHLMRGRFDLAHAVADAAREPLGPDEAELERQLGAVVVHTTSCTEAVAGRFDAERARVLPLTEAPTAAARGLAAVVAAVAVHRGERSSFVRPLVERALTGGTLLSGRPGTTFPGAHLLIALAGLDAPDEGLEAARAMRTAGRARGSVHAALIALAHEIWMHDRAGDLRAAEGALRSSHAAVASMGSPTALASSFFYGQDALVERPGLSDLVDEVLALEVPEHLEPTWPGAAALSVRGRLRLARRDVPGGLADLRTSAATMAALGQGPSIAPSRSLLALALPASSREEALALAEEEIAAARACGRARPLGVALRAAGTLDGGDDGIDRLRESVALLEGSSARLEHARSLVALGAALRRGRHRVEARGFLSDGMDRAHRCGAERLVRHAAEELRAAGSRPRRPASTGRDALTVSEERVARLAADGATSAEIAQELVVGLKTVETHLTRAYAKLGIAGPGARGRLRGALDEPVP